MTPPVAKLRPLAGLKLTCADDPRTRPTYAHLKASIAAAGINHVPAFVTKDGRVIDGNTRVAAMLDLGLTEVWAIELPDGMTEADILRFSIATDGIRRTLPPEELADKASRFMELTGSTQERAAAELNISPATLSRALSLSTLPPKIAEMCKDLPFSVRAIIASERDSTVQEKLAEYASTPVNGKLPTREMVELKRKPLKPKKDRPKSVKGKFEGREFTFTLTKDDKAYLVAEWLKTIAKKIEKAEIGPEGWSLLFR